MRKAGGRVAGLTAYVVSLRDSYSKDTSIIEPPQVNSSGESAVSSSQAAPAAESLATQQGLTLVETVAMSGMVYSGLAQVVSLQSWPHDITFPTVLTLMLVTLTVNLRFFLMSLTFRPWFSGLPAWQAYPALLFMTDVGWLRAMRYRSEGGGDVGFFLGGGLLLYLVWLASTATGFVFSSWLTNPKTFGIDLLLPTFFATLLIPAWRGVRRAVPWLVAGLVAAAVEHFVADYWYIISGALCGAVAAGLSGDA